MLLMDMDKSWAPENFEWDCGDETSIGKGLKKNLTGSLEVENTRWHPIYEIGGSEDGFTLEKFWYMGREY